MLNRIRTPTSMINVDSNVTTINGAGGTYPLITALSTIPSGTANNQPPITFINTEAITLLFSFL